MEPSNLQGFLVTGACGMVGSSVHFGRKYGHSQLDVGSRIEVARIFELEKPTGILHLAGLDIRQSEANPQLALQVNVNGTYNLALEARSRSIPLVFVSSGAVFSGTADTTFDETSKPAPLNVYGQTKFIAELLLREMLNNVLIARTGWLFGGHGAHQPKFVDVAIELARGGHEISATYDQRGSPTYVYDFLENLERLIVNQTRGIVHIVNDGAATAVDLAREIVRITESSSTVDETQSAMLNSGGPKRSPSEALASTELKLRSWQDALRDYISIH